jgi:hypothetical protein
MKGENGRGTVFWMEVTESAQVIKRHEWGLLEELAGKFKPSEVIAGHLKEMLGRSQLMIQ